MKILILICLLYTVSQQAYAKEYKILAELLPPYSYYENKTSAGIFKDILDAAFKDSKHSFVLHSLNSKTLITAIKSKEFDTVIGFS